MPAAQASPLRTSIRKEGHASRMPKKLSGSLELAAGRSPTHNFTSQEGGRFRPPPSDNRKVSKTLKVSLHLLSQTVASESPRQNRGWGAERHCADFDTKVGIDTAPPFGGNPQDAPFLHITPLWPNCIFQVRVALKDMLSRRPTLILPLSSSSCSDSTVSPFRTSVELCRVMPTMGGGICSRSAFGAPDGGGGRFCSSEASLSPVGRLSSSSKRSPSPMSSLHELIGTHAPLFISSTIFRLPPQLILDKEAFGAGVVPSQ